jgi:hypothetical protein
MKESRVKIFLDSDSFTWGYHKRRELSVRLFVLILTSWLLILIIWV